MTVWPCLDGYKWNGPQHKKGLLKQNEENIRDETKKKKNVFDNIKIKHFFFSDEHLGQR